MAQPVAYDPNHDYSEELGNTHGGHLDEEFLDIQTTTDQIRANLAEIQRDDGALVNGIVTPESLSGNTVALIGDLTLRGEWVTLTAYAVNDLVRKDDVLYGCLVAHTAGTFSTDLSASKWISFGTSVLASGISVTPAGGLAATDVQAALEELDSDLTAHINDASAAHAGSAISFPASGTIAATTVTGAIQELDSETQSALALKAPLASPTFTGTPAAPTASQGTSTTQLATTGFVQQELVTASNAKISRRQTVLSGALSSGVPSWISAGTGLQCNYAAASVPVVIAFANGFDARGDSDLVTRLTGDGSSAFGALAANSTSYLYATYSSASAITGGNTLVPPQYGETFARGAYSLVHFEGTDAATTLIDDFGNTWTAFGNAQIDTAQFKFGTASGLFDGTGDYWRSTNFISLHSLNNDGWTAECWVRWNSLPGSGAQQVLFSFSNDSGFGLQMQLHNNAGTTRMGANISSNGTGHNLENLSASSTKTTWSTGTWYHVAITYDPLQDRIYYYVDGVLDRTISPSGARVCGTTQAALGAWVYGAAGGTTERFLNGWLDEFRLLPFCKYPSGTTFTPAVAAYTVASEPAHFFSIPEMNMYEITGASSSAGTDPSMTARNRVFVGEADTGAATVSAVRNYAYRGRYSSAQEILALATRYPFSHNLGVQRYEMRAAFVNRIAAAGYQPGQTVWAWSSYSTVDSGSGFASETRNVASFTTTPTDMGNVPNRTTGGLSAMTPASWSIRVDVDRGW